MRVGDGGRRDEVVRRAVTETRPSIRSRALVTVGLGGPVTDEQGAEIAGRLDHARTLERHATLFALGMAGSPEITALADSEDAETQHGAQWWIDQGPAIRDADVPSAS
jgi:hypothetical protein